MIDHYFVSFVLGFIGGSFSDPHNQGNFGPFQICYDYGISVCGGGGPFKTRGKETQLHALAPIKWDIVFTYYIR